MIESKSKGAKTFYAAAMLVLMSFSVMPAAATTGQRRRTTHSTTKTVYSRAYSQGYSSGYLQGKSDWLAGLPRDFQASRAYQDRESHYERASVRDTMYRDGYDLGLELGYTDGYLGRAKSLVVPTHGQIIAAREAGQSSIAANSQPYNNQPPDNSQSNVPPANSQNPPDWNAGRPARGPLVVPNGTEMRLKLTSPIDTRTSHVGDKFTAQVLTPQDYEDATIYGHIATLTRSGRVSGKTTVALAFDSITLRDGRSARIDAQLEKMYESEAVKQVDDEGRIITESRTKDSEVRGGIGAAAGALIGGLAGGGKGALIGILLGGAAGVGTVYVEGNKDLILDRGTEMLIKVEQSRRHRDQ